MRIVRKGLKGMPVILLPEVEVNPIWLELKTYYPFISEYPYTGHSALGTRGAHVLDSYIDKGSSDSDYNLFTYNCSDATREALEKLTGKKINPYLFTTPGDVRDFFVNNFDVIPMKGGKGTDHYKTTISINDAKTLKDVLNKLDKVNRDEKLNKVLRERITKKLKLNLKLSPSETTWAKNNGYLK